MCNWWAPFASCSGIKEADYQVCDEALLVILGIQPSEIDRLDLADYWRWVDVAARRQQQRQDALAGLTP